MDFRNVPFKHVPSSVCKDLAELLDVNCRVFAADWTSLGAEIGLTFVEKKLMEEKLNGNESNTMALFQSWSKKPENTVGKILDAFEKIKRPHEVRKLLEAENEILKSYYNSGEADSIFQACDDKIQRTSELSVDLPSETSSFNEPYYLNSYKRYQSNVISEERNSRQPSHSIADTCSLVDSRFGHGMCPSRMGSSINDAVGVDENYNQTHSFLPGKIVNCGAIKDKKQVFITYGNGSKNHDSRIYHLCQFLENYFYCNVDLKNKRLDKNKVDVYFSRANFVVICFDQEYMKSIHRAESDKEERPDELHTSYIYSKMKVEAMFKGSRHRFIPLILKGGSPNNIPLWLDNKYYKWPEQYKELSMSLTNPQNSFPFSDTTSI